MQPISDEVFVREMQIFWQNAAQSTRDRFAGMIEDYFNGARAERIINKMQVTLNRQDYERAEMSAQDTYQD